MINMKIGLRTLKFLPRPTISARNLLCSQRKEMSSRWVQMYIRRTKSLGLRSRGRPSGLLKSCAEAKLQLHYAFGRGILLGPLVYDLCYKYGFVVWHDFMFACGFYVYRDEFRESILKELDYNIRRVRNHPCIGLWCGNNEVEMARFWSHGKPEDIDEFRQYYLESYEKDFPALVSKLAPDTFYWPSSPSSGGNFDAANEPERGDIHYWDLWQGKGRWDAYKELNFKFLSEFGFESLPDMKTIESFAGPEDFDLESPVMQSHQKCPDGNNKMRYYMEELAHIPCDFESLVYVSQLIHAQVISGIIEFIRQKRNCNGVLYWQLNDTNPVISGSSIDYFGRWKALHYYKKESTSLLLS